MARNADGLGRKPHKWRGRWRAFLTVGYAADGRPERRYVYGRTEAECLAKVDAERRRLRLGLRRGSGAPTLAAFVEDWLVDAEARVAPRTLSIYRAELAHILPALGRTALTALTPEAIRRALRKLVGTEVRFGPGQAQSTTLSARSANAARTVLHNVLEAAVLDGWLDTNPAASNRVRPLKHQRREIRVWTAQEVTAFLDACLAGAAAQYALFYTALTTGLRVGELAALEWRDVHGDSLHVRRTAGGDGTKTKAANRVLKLPTDTLAVLEQHRGVLAAERIGGPLVFPTASGGMVTRSNVRRALARWAGHAGVTILTPHELRHTYASMAIANGMTPADLARQLGHTNAAFTLRTYVHFFERAAPRSAPSLAELKRAAGSRGGTLGGTVEGPN